MKEQHEEVLDLGDGYYAVLTIEEGQEEEQVEEPSPDDE